MALRPHEKHVLGFLLQHLLYGAVGGVVFGALVLWTDVGSIRTLALNSKDTVLILSLLFFGLFVTFGSIGMGIGIMSLGEERDEG